MISVVDDDATLLNSAGFEHAQWTGSQNRRKTSL